MSPLPTAIVRWVKGIVSHPQRHQTNKPQAIGLIIFITLWALAKHRLPYRDSQQRLITLRSPRLGGASGERARVRASLLFAKR